jgi:hypothetical protein
LTGLKAIDVLYLSGTRATFTLKNKMAVSESEVAAALTQKGLEFVDFSREERPMPAAAYVAEATGLG